MRRLVLEARNFYKAVSDIGILIDNGFGLLDESGSNAGFQKFARLAFLSVFVDELNPLSLSGLWMAAEIASLTTLFPA